MRLNRRVPVGTHGGVRGRLSIRESLLLDFIVSKTIRNPSVVLKEDTLGFFGMYGNIR